MARKPITAQEFAAELTQAGMRIRWIDCHTFDADNRRRLGNHRSARVHFYRDVNQFYYAAWSWGRLRSMAAVRRYLVGPTRSTTRR